MLSSDSNYFKKQKNVISRSSQSVFQSLSALKSNQDYLCCIVGIFSQQFAFACLIVSLSLYLQSAQSLTALHASYVLFPMTILFAIASIVAGKWIDNSGVRGTSLFGLVSMTVMVFSCAFLSAKTSLVIVVGLMPLIGITTGIAFAALNSGLVKLVAPSLVGTGSSLFTMLALAGNFIGATLTVFLYEVNGIAAVMIMGGIILLGAVIYYWLMSSSDNSMVELGS